jgi:hypothetical protein
MNIFMSNLKRTMQIPPIQAHCNPTKTKCFLGLSKVYGLKPCIFVHTNFFNTKQHILDQITNEKRHCLKKISSKMFLVVVCLSSLHW